MEIGTLIPAKAADNQICKFYDATTKELSGIVYVFTKYGMQYACFVAYDETVGVYQVTQPPPAFATNPELLDSLKIMLYNQRIVLVFPPPAEETKPETVPPRLVQ